MPPIRAQFREKQSDASMLFLRKRQGNGGGAQAVDAVRDVPRHRWCARRRGQGLCGYFRRVCGSAWLCQERRIRYASFNIQNSTFSIISHPLGDLGVLAVQSEPRRRQGSDKGQENCGGVPRANRRVGRSAPARLSRGSGRPAPPLPRPSGGGRAMHKRHTAYSERCRRFSDSDSRLWRLRHDFPRFVRARYAFRRSRT